MRALSMVMVVAMRFLSAPAGADDTARADGGRIETKSARTFLSAK